MLVDILLTSFGDKVEPESRREDFSSLH